MPAQYKAVWEIPDPDDEGSGWDLRVGWFGEPDPEIISELRPTDDGVWMILDVVHDGQPIGSAARLIPWPQ